MLVLYQLEPACVSTDAVIIIAGGGRAGEGRGTVSTQQAHVALCETRALHLYTSQCSVAVCQVSKGVCF